jgi:nucleoside-diphosphate-sugar epimerase
MRIAITGGAGFIGSELGFALKQAGHEVVLIDNFKHGYETNLRRGKQQLSCCNVDIRDPHLSFLFKGVDTVFHMAAISSLPICQANPQYAYDNNVSGTANVLEAARLKDVRRVVFSSSSAIYENNYIFPSKETYTVDPTLVYPSTKLAAEQLCDSFGNNYGMEIVKLRYCNVYGSNADSVRQNPPFFMYVIRELINKKPVRFYHDGTQKRDYVYINDVITANMVAMHTDGLVGEVVNITTGEVLSVNQIFDKIASILHSEAVPIYSDNTAYWCAYPELYIGKPLIDGVVENEVTKTCWSSGDKMYKITGWRPRVPFDKGIASTIDKYKRMVA